MTDDRERRSCFVIAPIGEEGSDVRARSDQVLTHIITPVANRCGYEPTRADKISEPGMITSQVIQRIIEDDLVIADLTGHNPNVFYELAIRHAVRKPIVQIIAVGEKIPFDVSGSRTVPVDYHDLDSVATAKEEIAKQIKAVEDNPKNVDTPISAAVQLQDLRASDNPLEKSNAEIIEMLQDIRSALTGIREEPHRSRIHPELIEELVMRLGRLDRVLALDPEEEPSRERFMEARKRLRRFEQMLGHLCMEAGLPPSMVERHLFHRG